MAKGKMPPALAKYHAAKKAGKGAKAPAKKAVRRGAKRGS